MQLVAKVYHNSIRASAPDAMGARAFTIEARRVPEFEGAPVEAGAYLRALPIGLSVEVRFERAGQFAGARSCMNKPALWADVEGRA